MSAATLPALTAATSRDGGRLAPLLLGALVGAMVAGRIETAVGCVVVAGAAAAASGARAPSARWIGTLAVGALVAVTLNLYLSPGRALPLPEIAGRAATAEGLRLGALLALRLAGAALAVQGLAAAWPGERAADEAARLLGPLQRLRVPVREARAVLGLALRLVPLLGEEARRIGRLQAARAGRPAHGLAERLRRRRAAVVPTLVGALERAERVALALEARHYRVRPAGPGPRRWPATVAGAVVAGVALWWRG
ncbi:MAG: hypothetical protein A2W00_06835 [Candidatus Eisenbacteria bacterium RBG_16_71_46]|nr:MAG: hypothetical protein A2W00_06835 [Candidatus Eisenbacteria bacterium RBG_16_71_46]